MDNRKEMAAVIAGWKIAREEAMTEPDRDRTGTGTPACQFLQGVVDSRGSESRLSQAFFSTKAKCPLRFRAWSCRGWQRRSGFKVAVLTFLVSVFWTQPGCTADGLMVRRCNILPNTNSTFR